MKLLAILMATLGLLGICAAPALAQKSPSELAGFTLGTSVDQFKDRLNMDSVLPIRHCETLKEVETLPMPGFRSGLVYYGTCSPDKPILRIKMKTRDYSPQFFQKLLVMYKERFGQPDEWRGDAFQTVRAWKWSFKDAQGRSVSLILQHNLKDDEEKIGNTIKLALPDLINQECGCGAPTDKKLTQAKPPDQPVDIEQFVPR